MATQFAPGTQASEKSLVRAGQHGDAQALNLPFHRYQVRMDLQSQRRNKHWQYRDPAGFF
jgi:hypothetical protein